MSSECRCHLNEFCFYCEIYSPLEEEKKIYKSALVRIVSRTSDDEIFAIANGALEEVYNK